jgi:hypothetical protein
MASVFKIDRYMQEWAREFDEPDRGIRFHHGAFLADGWVRAWLGDAPPQRGSLKLMWGVPRDNGRGVHWRSTSRRPSR